ncbi:hypothetical protein FOA52_001339 [Chlamydomonas sp. UWO 241]|nr:hypothetical protein FOA52_001339 [Chlamydomonas sp. UWO 241]
MDGTLTEAHIDFADMRARTRIPQGDLFTVLESSTPEHISHAMQVILNIEAEAAKSVSSKEGLLELLAQLKKQNVPIALVTRNTTPSVTAFLNLIGPEWSSMFSPVLTREFDFVKPDKRLLLHVAQTWGVDPARVLMVGDSFEDVEVGNAAGTATCLVAGGGNEKPGAVVMVPAGAVPTMKVTGLPQLTQMLTERNGLRYGWPAREAAGEVVGEDGSPSPGLDFVDWCIEQRALRAGSVSFPRMGAHDPPGCNVHGPGMATSKERGSRVLHVACGAGGLTKMLVASGMEVMGTDADVVPLHARGLQAVPTVGGPKGRLVAGSLAAAREAASESGIPYDTVLLLGSSSDSSGAFARWWATESLSELMSVLPHSGGCLCAEVTLTTGAAGGINPAAVLEGLRACGLALRKWQVVELGSGRTGSALRLIATRLPRLSGVKALSMDATNPDY